MVQTLWKAVWQFLTELNIPLQCNSATVLLHICPKDLKTYVHTKTNTHVFMTSLLIIIQTRKQPRCPLEGKCINKLVHPENAMLFSAEKKWAIKPWKDMEETLMHIIKWKKPIYKGNIHYDSKNVTFCKGKIMGTVKISGVAGREGWLAREQRVFMAVKILCMIIQWWIHFIIHLYKPIESTTPSPLWCKLWALGDYDVSIRIHQL